MPRKMDFSKSYGNVCGGTGPAMYEQDGLEFDHNGLAILPDVSSPVPETRGAEAAPVVPLSDVPLENMTMAQLRVRHHQLTGKNAAVMKKEKLRDIVSLIETGADTGGAEIPEGF